MHHAQTQNRPRLLSSPDAFLASAQRLPLLSAEQEADLLLRCKGANDTSATEILVLAHLKLVSAVARQYRGYGLPEADLVQEGAIGLLKAVQGYEPGHGARFATYASQWVKAEIHEYILRNCRVVKIATTKAYRKLFFKLRSSKVGSRAMSPAEVSALAEKLGVKESEVTEMEVRLAGGDVSLDTHDEDDGYPPVEALATRSTEPSRVIEQRANEWAQTAGLQEALASLDERSRHIVSSRWFADESPATLQDLATEYGISPERVRQIESKAFKTMRSSLAPYVQ